MSEARELALMKALEDYEPPPRMTTPRRSRERLRKAVEASLKSQEWRYKDGRWRVDAVQLVSGSRTSWTMMVLASRLDEVGFSGSVLEFWMDNAKPIEND